MNINDLKWSPTSCCNLHESAFVDVVGGRITFVRNGENYTATATNSEGGMALLADYMPDPVMDGLSSEQVEEILKLASA